MRLLIPFILLADNVQPLSDGAQEALLNASPYNPITYGVLVLILGFAAWLGIREIIRAKNKAEDKYDKMLQQYLDLSQDSISMLSKVEEKISTIEITSNRVEKNSQKLEATSDKVEITSKNVEEIKSILQDLKMKLEYGAFCKTDKSDKK